MGLREYVIRRSIYMFLLVVAVVCFNFFLFRLPTLVLGVSPVDLMISEELRRNLTRDAIEQLYLRFGLVPDPDIFDWIYMFWRYVVNMFTWSFGLSFQTMRPVVEDLSWRLPTTVLLLGSALVATILVGIPMGILAGSRRGSKVDVAAIGAGLFTWGVPVFFIQLLFMMFFCYYAKLIFGFSLFPVRGLYSIPPPTNPFAYMADVAWHLALPLITLVVGSFGSWALYTRNLLLDSLTQDYVVTARAKGLTERTVLYRHAFRSTLPPIVTMITLSVPGIVTGAMITEWIFTIPGIGRWYLNSLMAADYPVIQSVLFIFAVLVIVANLVADLLYGVLDPRIRIGMRR